MSWIQSAFGSKISPIILFIIVLLAVVFFAAAILHLIIRFLLKQRSRQSYRLPEMYSGPFQRQLQHLFHLHDSGLDQAYIDALPVFVYSDIVGSKQPFDCAVCLCEFSEFDELRLLPVCSHAFHIDCIDTWLLSNSTCPLCRGVILSAGFSCDNPVFTVHDSKENEDGSIGSAGFVGVPCVLRPWENDNGAAINEKRVFSVRLGKFRSTNTVPKQEIEAGESSSISLDARRCFSMGSLQYVVADLDLQVALCPSRRSRDQEHGAGASDVRPVIGKDGRIRNFVRDGDHVDADEKKINNGAKGESFSVSKIWLWSKKGRLPTSANFANPVHLSSPNRST